MSKEKNIYESLYNNILKNKSRFKTLDEFLVPPSREYLDDFVDSNSDETISNAVYDGKLFNHWENILSIDGSTFAKSVTENGIYYFHSFEDSPIFLCFTDNKKNKLIDIKFLELLADDNGDYFNTNIFTGIPSNVLVHIDCSGDSIVNFFYKIIEWENLWDELQNEYPLIWDEEYENPSILFLTEQTRKKLDKKLSKINKPPGIPVLSMVYHYSKRKNQNYTNYLRKNCKLPLTKIPFRKTKKETDSNKYKMIIRYLNEICVT